MRIAPCPNKAAGGSYMKNLGINSSIWMQLGIFVVFRSHYIRGWIVVTINTAVTSIACIGVDGVSDTSRIHSVISADLKAAVLNRKVAFYIP